VKALSAALLNVILNTLSLGGPIRSECF